MAWRLSLCRIDDRGNASLLRCSTNTRRPRLRIRTSGVNPHRLPGRGPSRQRFEASFGGRINGQKEATETERNETIAVDQQRNDQLSWVYRLAPQHCPLFPSFPTHDNTHDSQATVCDGSQGAQCLAPEQREFLLRKATRKSLHSPRRIYHRAQAPPAQIMYNTLVGSWRQTKTSEMLRPLP